MGESKKSKVAPSTSWKTVARNAAGCRSLVDMSPRASLLFAEINEERISGPHSPAARGEGQ